ncbi:MAG: arsenate reductase ArsC [Clostridia bacterium]|nr:arsenate reductase ArsC [Clostridia bacterium]
MDKKTIAFVCVHNSCRSQIAEGWAGHLGGDVIVPYSAGTEKYHEVKPFAVKVMKEAGVDISSHHPKLLDDIPFKVDILISMGCGVSCPFVLCDYEEDWGIEDPSGGSLDDFRRTRDILRTKVEKLIADIKAGKYEKHS